MPQLGETVTEGTVTRWLKSVGDKIEEDEALFEVSTDKVDSEVPSPASGYLAEILVQEGETVDVGAKLAVVTAEPPGQSAGGDGSATQEAEAPQEAPREQAPAQQAPSRDSQAQGAPQAPAQEPPAPEPARPQAGQQASQPQAEQRPPEQPPRAEPNQQAAQPPQQAQPAPPRPSEGNGSGGGAGEAGEGASRVLSPVVRRLLAEHHLDPSQIRGTGAGGRITRSDVLAAVDQRSGPNVGAGQPAVAAPPAPPPAEQEAPPSQPAAPPQPAAAGQQAAPQPGVPQATQALVRQPMPAAPAVAGARDEIVPFTNIRRRTAEHMVRSKATSAHTLAAVEVDYEGIEAVRRAHKDRFRAEEGISLSYLPSIARGVAVAIREFPHLNASVGDDALIVHHDLHLGIAVDLGDEGLIVPVIHLAADKRLRLIAREVADLAQRARGRKLTADDIAGGTFTITNPGPFGTFMTVPIINQPQVGILSTDGVKRRPVVVTMPDGSEGIGIHSTGILALSFDHRAVDGAYASRFLARLKEIIETRDWSQEL